MNALSRASRARQGVSTSIAGALTVGGLAMLVLAQTACDSSCEGGHWENSPQRMCTASGGATVTAPARFGFPATIRASNGRTCIDGLGQCMVTPAVYFSIPVSKGGHGLSLDIDLRSAESGMTYDLPLPASPSSAAVAVFANIMNWDSSEITHTRLELLSGRLTVESLTPEEVRVSFAIEMVIPETGEPVSIDGGNGLVDQCIIQQRRVCVGGD